MASKTPAALHNIVSATLDFLPSKSGPASKSWRSIYLAAEVARSDLVPCVAKQHYREPAHAGHIRKSSSQHLSFTPLKPSRTKHRPSFSRVDSSTRSGTHSFFSTLSLNSKMHRSFPVQRPFNTQTYRYLSTSRLSPFRFRIIPQYRSLNLTPSRKASNGTTSHNLLAHMEQTANNNPMSATAQNAFYSALLRANMPEIVAERYETGRYATNSACDAMYHRSLERLNQTASMASTATAGQRGGLSQDQLNAIGRAAAAHTRGATSITSVTTGAGAGSGAGAGETGAKDSPLHVVIDESIMSHILKWFRFVILVGLTGYFALISISFAIEVTGLFKRATGASDMEVKAEQQKARFSDVQGCDEAKEEMEEIVEFLKSPEKFNSLGGKLPKGVLLVGPPGTGKTLLARAVAGEAGVPFFYMAGSEFDEVYVGVGAKRVRDLFAAARAKAPAIVFIDELDAVGGRRTTKDAAYHMQTLNQLLTELDGFDQESNVVILAATNFPQMLDKALTRPGRFDRNIIVGLPDVRGRIDILKYHMRNMQIGTDVDASVLARGTPGFSGADLESLVNQGAIHASKEGAKKIRMVDLDWAKDRIMLGAEKKNGMGQPKDKELTAYHEAGHALVAMFTAGADPLYKCTILPRGHALGVTHQMPEVDKVSMTKTEYLANIDICMGGRIAEELLYGTDHVTSGCSSDLSQATGVARNMVASYGMSEALGPIAYEGKMYSTLSSETKQKIEDEIRRFLNEGQERARALLISKRKELDLLAKALLEYETLNKEEMEKVVKGLKLPEKLKSLPGVPMKLPDIPSNFGVGNGDNSGSSDENPGTKDPQRPVKAA